MGILFLGGSTGCMFFLSVACWGEIGALVL